MKLSNKAFFIIEVDANLQQGRIVRISDESFDVLDAQIDLGATPRLRWNVRSRWFGFTKTLEELSRWISDWEILARDSDTEEA